MKLSCIFVKFNFVKMDYSFIGNKEAERAIDLVKYSNKSVLLTGKAGTGKSTLLKQIISDLKKKYVLLAPTGIAAINIGGQTIHSFFEFGFRPYLPNDKDLPNLFAKLDLLQKLDIIIIDEISMVRVDIMNAIDLTLKRMLNNSSPFGGKQLLLVGDLFQLPPVVDRRKPEEAKIIREEYPSEFFFDSPAFNDYKLEVIELQQVYRQNESDFVKVLNNIRTNQITDADLFRINSRCQKDIGHDGIITLTTKNATVDSINSQELSKIKNSLYEFKATVTGTFANKHSTNNNGSQFRYPTDTNLKLKEGAHIIFVKNDSEKKWVNGTIGEISKIENNEIEINVGGCRYLINKETWEDIDYKWNKKENKIEEEVVGTFTQYPIRLAWAITIHKSQGQTFNKVMIDMDTGAFAFGQTYVALSRCTSIRGISLTKKINRSDIKVSDRVIKYLSINGIESIQKRDELEIDLIGQIKGLENEIEQIQTEKKIVKKEVSQQKEAINNIKVAYEHIKIENEYLKKEIERLKAITWIQKLFGAK